MSIHQQPSLLKTNTKRQQKTLSDRTNIDKHFSFIQTQNVKNSTCVCLTICIIYDRFNEKKIKEVKGSIIRARKHI